MRGESWRHKWEAPKRYERPGDCKNLSVSPQMQSQIAFVPRRPQLVSVAEFDDEPICLFVRIETARRQTAKCPCRVIARDFDDQSANFALKHYKLPSARWSGNPN